MCISKLRTWGSYLKTSSPLFSQFAGVLEVVFYTTLPTIISLLFSLLDKGTPSTEGAYYINGEFLLYSIALLSSAYTTMKVYRNQKTSLVIILIIVVSISYAIVIKSKTVNAKALLVFSMVAFVFGLCYTWRAMSLKNPATVSFQERDKAASDKLQDRLDYE